MKRFKSPQSYFLLILILNAFLITGCGGGGGETGHWLLGDTTAPTVTHTINANGATGVAVNTKISATFSEAMDPATITATTFTFKQGATAVAGTVSYTGVSAVFAPASTLTANTVYTATITTGARDLAGNPLANDYVWSWTTGAAPDTTAPTVSFTIPVNGDTGVAVNSSMSATFSEGMDPLTITNVTFTLTQGGTPVSGNVTYAGVTATFKPLTSLAFSTLYTATITTGARDLAGNALAVNKVWTFTTGAAPDTTAPTVSSTIPVNGATGVAVNSSMSATFSEGMDPLTITNVTFTLTQGGTPVSGAATYAGVTATFKPLTSLAFSTLYTATITSGARDLAGNALAVNRVWTFTTGAAPDTTAPTVSSTIPVNGATAVAVNSSMSATFSEGMDPLTITNVTFTLTQGGTPVAGDATYAGVTATFKPLTSLAFSTLYTATITTGARDLAGNALAVNRVWTFTTGAAPDTTAPTVSSTIPVNAATGVAVNSSMSATFSEAMNPLTITNVTFTLTQGGTPVAGDATYAGVTVTFKPLTSLAFSTLYTATITTGARDLAGNALAVNRVWTFTTGAAPDTTAPTVSSTIPVNAATGVAVNSSMSATFSEAMNPLTITNVTFTLTQGGTPVAGDATYAGVTATFKPLTSLAFSTLYTATITTGARDLAGNALAVNRVWTFTTGAAPDTTAPTVSSTIPINAATGVAVNSSMAAIFSEAMDPLTITNVTFTLTQGGTPVAGDATYAGVTATFKPLTSLAFSTLYTATITTGARDLAGNALAVNKVWTFTTGAAQDTTAPFVRSTIPIDGASSGVAVNSAVSAVFSEAMDPLTITNVIFTLKRGATEVSGDVTYAGVMATFAPIGNLAGNTLYTATITTGAKDLAGNALSGIKVWTFATGDAPDITRPTVTSTVPANAATNVATNTTVKATFSEAMHPLTTTAATFTLAQGSTPVSGDVTYAGVTATFTPLTTLANSTTYTATVTSGAMDLAGNQLAGNQAPLPAASNYIWTFTTGAIAPPAASCAGPGPVDMGDAANFAVLVGPAGGATLTNNGLLTTVTGDVGAASIVTAPTITAGYNSYTGVDAAYTAAKAAMLTAIGCASAGSRACSAGAAFNFGADHDFGGDTLDPGVYCVTGLMSVGSNLTLTNPGVYIFRSSGTLTSANNITVAFGGTANATNTSIFWVPTGAASIGSGNAFLGTIMPAASAATTLGANTTLLGGRAFSNSDVTLSTNTITIP